MMKLHHQCSLQPPQQGGPKLERCSTASSLKTGALVQKFEASFRKSSDKLAFAMCRGKKQEEMTRVSSAPCIDPSVRHITSPKTRDFETEMLSPKQQDFRSIKAELQAATELVRAPSASSTASPVRRVPVHEDSPPFPRSTHTTRHEATSSSAHPFCSMRQDRGLQQHSGQPVERARRRSRLHGVDKLERAAFPCHDASRVSTARSHCSTARSHTSTMSKSRSSPAVGPLSGSKWNPSPSMQLGTGLPECVSKSNLRLPPLQVPNKMRGMGLLPPLSNTNGAWK